MTSGSIQVVNVDTVEDHKYLGVLITDETVLRMYNSLCMCALHFYESSALKLRFSCSSFIEILL